MSTVLKKELAKMKKMIHPNSRKSIAIVKKTKKICNRNRAKQVGSMKQMLVREKMIWLQDHMVADISPYTPELMIELLEKYVARHNEELTYIAQKNQVIGKKNKSHASREDVLRMTKEREKEEYENCGIEIPNILVASQCSMLRKWDGDVRYLPNFVFRRLGRKSLNEMIQRSARLPKSTVKSSSEKRALPQPEFPVTATMDTE